ncbi:MAG TPA: hypothetical protein PLS57_10095 [Smithellaceae bacterium]|jgi:hypothetical protein|nr:hypothetical protein [Smithella sp.]HPM71256.1 hypothetical protein [Smithellaceae bacterium]HQC19994.1 hypothetical protein [Smithella sp.]HQI24759.1 hypothetical protein [Smithella sp.]
MGGDVQLSRLVDVSNADETLKEVIHICRLIKPDFNTDELTEAFREIQNLFKGNYPGFQACNTKYHDFAHTLMVLLAMARLMHGACLQGISFSYKDINLGMISALMHDAGYMQSVDDVNGTGAKFTLIHIERSIQFIQNHYAGKACFADDMNNFSDILQCTGLKTDIPNMKFTTEKIALLGKMLGTADLLGQMADRFYLEKLITLYDEFQEGCVPGFDSKIDLLRKTIGFYSWTKTRLENDFGNVARFMADHFRERWHIEGNLYEETMDRNIDYLKSILKSSQENTFKSLRRKTITI